MSGIVKINNRQLTILAALVTIGDSIVVLPTIPAFEAKRDAWISAIIGLVVGLLVIWLITATSKLHPKLSLIQMNEKIFGKWFGGLLSLIFLGYLLMSISAHLREMGDFNVSQVLPDTPIEAIHILLLLLVIVAVYLGLETFTRAGEIVFPWVLILFLLLILSLLNEIDMKKIMPILDNGWKPVLRGSLACIAYPFMELVVFLMIFPHVSKDGNINRSMLIGTTIGGLVLFLMITFTILVVGAEPSGLLSYPGYDLAKRISVGRFVERIEAFLALLWIITTFFKLSVYLYGFAQGLKQMFRLTDYKDLLLPTGMLLVGMSIVLAPNVAVYNNTTSKYWPFMNLTFSVFYPILLFIGYAIRQRLRQQPLEEKL